MVVEQVAVHHSTAGIPDSITWKWTPSGLYTASSAYQMQFLGTIHSTIVDDIWKTQIPSKCKFHAWLMVHGKCLTADNLAKRGWPHNPICSLCHTTPETAAHLAVFCSFSQVVWSNVRAKLHLSAPVTPLPTHDLATWWLDSLHGSTATSRKAENSLIMLTWWMLWKERNARIFYNKAATTEQVTDKIMDELRFWKMVGLGGVVAFTHPPD